MLLHQLEALLLDLRLPLSHCLRLCLSDGVLLLHVRCHLRRLAIGVNIGWLTVLSDRSKVDLLLLRRPGTLRRNPLHCLLLRCIASNETKLLLLQSLLLPPSVLLIHHLLLLHERLHLPFRYGVTDRHSRSLRHEPHLLGRDGLSSLSRRL